MEVELSLPRFKLSAGGSMTAALRGLGLKETFDSNGGFLKMPLRDTGEEFLFFGY